MHYTTLFVGASLLALSAAAPLVSRNVTTTATATQYYVCSSNGFRGICSVDPCALPSCPDPDSGSGPGGKDPEVCPKGKKYYSCAAFKGCSSTDPCSVSDPGCYAGGYYQVCDNGFKGCSKVDECINHCPVKGERYQVCENGLKGCSADDLCKKTGGEPDDETILVPTGKPDPCAAGYFYQICYSGFKGCSKVDECGKSGSNNTTTTVNQVSWIYNPVTNTWVNNFIDASTHNTVNIDSHDQSISNSQSYNNNQQTNTYNSQSNSQTANNNQQTTNNNQQISNNNQQISTNNQQTYNGGTKDGNFPCQCTCQCHH